MRRVVTFDGRREASMRLMVSFSLINLRLEPRASSSGNGAAVYY